MDIPLKKSSGVKNGISSFLWHRHNFERICSFLSVPFEELKYHEINRS